MAYYAIADLIVSTALIGAESTARDPCPGERAPILRTHASGHDRLRV